MDNKYIRATDFGPEIEMDASGTLKIRGKSMMEDASIYFKPCQEWVNEYTQNVKVPITVIFELLFFNSSSAKQILKLLIELDESPIEANVVWIYPKGNDVLLERGQELEIMLDLPFEFCTK
jgi:hypothetical protein